MKFYSPFAVLALFIGIPSPYFAQTLEAQLAAEGSAALAQAASEEGDPQRGAVVFYQPFLACTKCHAVGDKENSLGPDLAKIGAEIKTEHLVESILIPSKTIRKGFETVNIETNDGRSITGLVVEETADKLVLRDVSKEGTLVTLAKGEIEQRVANQQSIMPAAQVNQLTGRQQFLDLVRYLQEIAAGGPARAKELQPPPSLFVFQVPEYEKVIDHAGMIADLNQKAFKRGEKIYKRLCINCHGTREQPGSLPTSLRFASGKFKNGSDPYRMYQTLTHGFGLMTPQTWMVPEQKYDVIHYIREEYLKQHNPTQFAKVDREYLKSLPAGSTRGPAPSNIEPWVTMNYGPWLMATYEVGDKGTNFAHKGIAVRLDPGPGGVSQGKQWMVFDHGTLRMAAGWLSDPSSKEPGFIDYDGINFNGRHQVHPHVVGQIQATNPAGPGWAHPITRSWDDPRTLGRDGKRYGSLPAEWGKFKGLYDYGERVVLSYTIGDTEILESPATETKHNTPLLTRTFCIGPRERELLLQVASLDSDKAKVKYESVQHHALRNRKIPILYNADGLTEIAAGVSFHEKQLSWQSGQRGSLLLRILAGKDTLYFSVSVARLKAYKPTEVILNPSLLMSLETQPAHDLSKLLPHATRRWPETLKTAGILGPDQGPFAVDVLTPPVNNPWSCQMRLTGFDFFPDGDRAAVCSWDGDVWLVSGLLGKPTASSDDSAAPRTIPLSWQRIASGLFQPLGVKIVDEMIFVSCRDQIVKLHDLNGDGETDFYECFNSDHQVTEHFHEFAMGLQADAAGNFYYAKSARHALPAVVPHHGTLLRVAPDGSRTDILANGFRAANGVCLNPDGSFVVTDQEGHWNPKNRINWVKPGGFYGNMFGYHDVKDSSDAAMQQPLCWITNDFDRSPAELLWVTSDRWGPLKGSLLNFSYGYGKVYIVPHEQMGGQMQGGMCELPLPQFPTGIMRGRFNPLDGQLYTCGMFAWAGSVTQPGGFYRIRYTGRPVYVPSGLAAKRNGLSITFTGPLDPATVEDVSKYKVATWSLKRTADYGSKHYDERTLQLAKATLSADRRTVFLELPEIRPTWCMSVSYTLKSTEGEPVQGVIHNTIHALSD